MHKSSRDRTVAPIYYILYYTIPYTWNRDRTSASIYLYNYMLYAICYQVYTAYIEPSPYGGYYILYCVYYTRVPS